MIETSMLGPGITLRCFRDSRFKQGRISVQMVRRMCHEEAALNALLPVVLLRGTRYDPDLRAITMRLDELYGATVGDLVRRIGDYQTTGFYCGFTEDRFAMPGDRILAPTVEFLRQLLLEPLLEDGVFCREVVRSEKRNMIADIEAQKNDKAAYASAQFMRGMCRGDSFSVPRLGSREQVEAITPEGLYAHYRKLLRESRIELFYVGSAPAAHIRELLAPLFRDIERDYVNPGEQTPFCAAESYHGGEEMDIAQSRLCMGFVTDVTNRDPAFPAMQVLNTLYGAGMTSKLFQNVREKLSLCYSIGSGYYGTKGIITVSAGIDADKETVVREEILRQLQLCREGQITPQELTAAKEAVLSGLRSITDSPGTIEGYFSTAALSGIGLEVAAYREAVRQVTLADVVAAANRLYLHSTYFLKGAVK